MPTLSVPNQRLTGKAERIFCHELESQRPFPEKAEVQTSPVFQEKRGRERSTVEGAGGTLASLAPSSVTCAPGAANRACV